MRYCLNASTIRPTPLLDKIRIAGEIGYGAIELWHDDLDAHIAKGGTLADVKSALADQGLAVPTTIYLADWFDAAPEAYPVVLEECKRRMAQAAELVKHYNILLDAGLSALLFRPDSVKEGDIRVLAQKIEGWST